MSLHDVASQSLRPLRLRSGTNFVQLNQFTFLSITGSRLVGWAKCDRPDGRLESVCLGIVGRCYNPVMNTAHPDIVVVGPDGEYLIVVEVKVDDSGSRRQDTIEQLKNLMATIGCSIGLAVTGEEVFLLRDSLEKSHGESINVVGEAKLPDYLLPPADEQWRGARTLEFESRVQRWLEQLKQISNLETLPEDLRELLGEPIISLFRLGDIRAAGPRWSRIAS